MLIHTELFSNVFSLGLIHCGLGLGLGLTPSLPREHHCKKLVLEHTALRQRLTAGLLLWSTSSLLWDSCASMSVETNRFYRAMLCIRGTSHGPVSVRPSVCLSVTSRSSTKTAKRRVTQTTPHDSPGSLVFCCQKSPRNSTGFTPYEGAECRWGGSKSATFVK